MPDLLVKLYDLPPLIALEGVVIRPGRSFERARLRAFVERHFNAAWADEADSGMTALPATTFLATVPGEKRSKIVGFASYDCTCRGFFGPTGVDPAQRGRGVGKALLVQTLHAMRHAGYAYAVIGSAGPVEFYQSFCNAIIIDGSEPGFYGDLLA